MGKERKGARKRERRGGWEIEKEREKTRKKEVCRIEEGRKRFLGSEMALKWRIGS
jgi:hypothetical protein